MSVYEAAQESRLAALCATRDALAKAIDSGGGTIAQEVAQLRAVLAEIDALAPPEQKGTALDEFTKRRLESGPASRAKGPAKRAK